MALPRTCPNVWQAFLELQLTTQSPLSAQFSSQALAGRKAWGIYQVGTLTIQDMDGDDFVWALAEDIDGLLEQGRMAAIEGYKAQVWKD